MPKFSGASFKFGADSSPQAVVRTLEAIRDLNSRGRWSQAFSDAGLPASMATLADSDARVEFVESGARCTTTAFEFVRAAMAGQRPNQVSPDRGCVPVDPASARLDKIARGLVRKDRSLDFGEALREARRLEDAEDDPEFYDPDAEAGDDLLRGHAEAIRQKFPKMPEATALAHARHEQRRPSQRPPGWSVQPGKY